MIQNRLNDKEKDIQGLKKQASSLLNCAWGKGYVAGFDDGYKTGRQAGGRLQDEWIPVDERLPEEGVSVLVCVETQGGISQYVSERFKNIYWSALCGMTPIAWRPLPEPYKKGGAT